MVEFGQTDILALKNVIAPEEDDDVHVYGSALNPATVAGRDKKEIAKPNVKVEVKTYNRDEKGGAPEEQIKAAEEAKKAAKKLADPKNVIWTDEEVKEAAEEIPDDRVQPDYEIIPK